VTQFGSLEDGQVIKVTIRRTPPAPELQEYEVAVLDGMTVFNVVESIRHTIDPSLAIPISCRIGKCDICLVRVNGRVRWLCTYPAADQMLLEPSPRYVVLKDLVVDWDRRIPAEKPKAGANETGGDA